MSKNRKNLVPKNKIKKTDSTANEKAMAGKYAKLLERRKGHWYYFFEGELDHIFRCIAELRIVSWAADLIKRAELAINLMDWFAENKDKINQLEWLENWAKMEELRTTFFEVRYAFDLYKQGITPTYEKPTLAKSSVDFEISVPGATFLGA